MTAGACVLLAACGDTSTDTDLPPDTDPPVDDSALELGGVWEDNYGGWTFIDSEHWGSYAIHQYDNTENWAVTQNPASDEWNPEKYNLVVWTERTDDETWWTCTVGYGLETMEEALAFEDTSDDTDPATSGCGEFSWTQMVPKAAIEVSGLWDDNYDGQTEITPIWWGTSRILDYNNTENWTITQNPADDEWYPSKYNLVVWTERAEDETWWACTVGYGLETMEDALTLEDTSDDSDPATRGCGDFTWTQMMSAE
jgi:hypothetical protein